MPAREVFGDGGPARQKRDISGLEAIPKGRAGRRAVDTPAGSPATAGSSSPRQAWTERTSASTRFRRAARSASRNELVWTVVKQPSPAASRRGRSGGGRTVQTVTMQEKR